jgi:hypothetical protein
MGEISVFPSGQVEELRAEYKKKLSSIELQLSGMVQLKVSMCAEDYHGTPA